MKKRIQYQYFIAVVAGVCLLSGCSKKAEENKALFREAGIACMEQADYAGAIEAFDTALKQKIGTVDADDIDICYYKAAAQNANDDIEGALTTYNAIIDFLPKEADAYYLRGCIYVKKGETENAQEDFSKAITYNPKDYELYIHIYENLSGAGDEDSAKEFLNMAFSIKGNAVSDMEYRGRIYCLLGEYENAIAELEAAKEQGSVTANLYLAQVYTAMGDAEGAEACYAAYFEQNEADSESLCRAGAFLLKERRYAEAITYLEQGLACDGAAEKQELMRNLVIAYEYNGNFDKAWELVQNYVTLYPNDEEAQTEYIFLKNRQIKEVPETESEQTSSDESAES